MMPVKCTDEADEEFDWTRDGPDWANLASK
jgi:hypothetical protein